MYRNCFKRIFDFALSIIAILLLSPLLIILILTGMIKMRGNPFFTQERPGKNGKIFKLIKFKSMNNKRDAEGNLLPDEVRLTSYGKFIRNTSLDELPELINIFKGDMAIVGPRPLLVKYLTRYNKTQARRHEVRPGLTGLAQVNGRNAISWEEKFCYDVEYVDNLSFLMDFKIICKTALKVIKRDGISSETSATMEEFMGQAKENNEL
ncbi:MAG: sugar transferase [Catonella sp.]|uniref:sugar transferase n=1 Tax=Catonella sp. TaxID=2382125 RepID=UPI003F9EBB8C